jgi:hypothetical protein
MRAFKPVFKEVLNSLLVNPRGDNLNQDSAVFSELNRNPNIPPIGPHSLFKITLICTSATVETPYKSSLDPLRAVGLE